MIWIMYEGVFLLARASAIQLLWMRNVQIQAPVAANSTVGLNRDYDSTQLSSLGSRS
jgi:hypothetical protein